MTYRQKLRAMSDAELIVALRKGVGDAAEGGWREYAMENGATCSPEYENAQAAIDEAARRFLGRDPEDEACSQCDKPRSWAKLEAHEHGGNTCPRCKRRRKMKNCSECGALHVPDAATADPMGRCTSCAA